MTIATRLRIFIYFMSGHTFRGCARKYGCTVREAEQAFRIVSKEFRR